MKTLFFLLVMCNAILAMATEITVEVDRNPVSLNESFQLTFTANQTPDGKPDFDPLTHDFDIINKSEGKQSFWVNGQSTASIQWTLQVMAKHAGSLLVPSIVFGADKTEPMTIMVMPAKTNSDANTTEDLLLKVEAAPLNPYVQAQVLYTMRLYRKVNMAQARLEEPKLTDAVIQKLGEDNNYNTQINGADYVVTERKYAIFPQKSGKVTIAPLTLTAEVVTDNAPRFNGSFNQQTTRTQKIASNAITLEVRPAPADIQMPHWLPAEDLQLKQEWSADITKMKVGEPLTRTLVVLAKAATVGLLPELNSPATDQALKSYPDQPTLKEMPKPEGIYAFREEKIAIIPSSAGTFTLPAIEVPWFNTQTQKMQVASLPATTLTVLAAPATAATSPVPTLAPVATTPATPMTQVLRQLPLFLQNNPWLWVAAFLGLGWLTTLLYFLTKRPSTKAPKITEKPFQSPPAPNNATQLLKQASQINNPQLAKQALLQWGLAEFDVHNLGALAGFCDARLRDEIQQLNQFLYAPQNKTEAWQGKRLLQAFNEQHATQKMQSGNKDDKLEPLFRL
ncbi:MAG: protein BatD [Methylococcaceae bacterium]|nr:protein BatD [Methylococcaceae bacterium]